MPMALAHGLRADIQKMDDPLRSAGTGAAATTIRRFPDSRIISVFFVVKVMDHYVSPGFCRRIPAGSRMHGIGDANTQVYLGWPV